MKGVNIQHTYCTCSPKAFSSMSMRLLRERFLNIQFQQKSVTSKENRILYNSTFLSVFQEN